MASFSIPPLRIPVVAIESVRFRPIRKVAFSTVKIVQVLEGSLTVETKFGIERLRPGHSLAIGSGTWCSLTPETSTRIWSIYLDDQFLRSHMQWALPVKERVIPGAHPLDWSGAPVVVMAGAQNLRQIEPIWRQLSIVRSSRLPPEVAAARTVTLFSRAVELSVPSLLISGGDAATVELTAAVPIKGHLSERVSLSQAGKAAQLLRTGFSEPWTLERLAQDVNLSRAQLSRLFASQCGTTPMRFLTEVRLTEFTRLVEETNLPLERAARMVGWQDSRVAAAWFRRRFDMSPSRFRRTPHPSVEDGTIP